MSQRNLEGLLGRLVTDQRLRRRFFEAPEQTCFSELYELSAREIEALLNLGEGEIEFLAQHLDRRVLRARPNEPAVLWEEECTLSALSVAVARGLRRAPS